MRDSVVAGFSWGRGPEFPIGKKKMKHLCYEIYVYLLRALLDYRSFLECVCVYHHLCLRASDVKTSERPDGTQMDFPDAC